MRRLRNCLLVLVLLVAALLASGPLLIALREPDALPATSPAGVAGRFLDLPGGRTHVVEAGSGAPLLLVHGFGASTADFEETVLEPLARSHRVIAVDLYGYGWSERRDDYRYGWTLWADQLAATLDALGIARASIAGHSMGGAAAAMFAVRHPDRIDRLILADALYPLLPEERPPIFRLLHTPMLGEVALGLVRQASGPGFSAAHGEYAAAWYRIRGTRSGALRYVRDDAGRAEIADAYPRIAAPTLVLHGTADTFVPIAAMERIAPTIPHARIVRIAGGGHFICRDVPDTFVREVDAFLAEP